MMSETHTENNRTVNLESLSGHPDKTLSGGIPTVAGIYEVIE